MKTLKVTFCIIIFIICNNIIAQINDYTYKLNPTDNLLTKEVKNVLDSNLVNKRVVFLGESEHHIGSDFLAKTEFVKYLVLEKGYKDIVFEGDFFGLYFDHNKINLFSFWSRSVQCHELFDFLNQHNITIWGLDSQMGSGYTYDNFTNKLTAFLKDNSIIYDQAFANATEMYIKNRKKANSILKKADIDYLIIEVSRLLKNDVISKEPLWFQILENFKSDILINTTLKSGKKGIPVRDTQMAKNLDFLVKTMYNKKIIVWLANAHMAKYEYDFMKGQTMGSQFLNMNPDISYHIAVSSIHMPYRKSSWIEKGSKDHTNLLYYLPSTNENYFIDSKQLISNNPEFTEKEYEGMFNLEKNKTNWFKHFDALVFISKGEKVEYKK